MGKIIEIQRTVTPQQAAENYGLCVGTLANERYHKRGPKYFKCGRKVLYRVEDLENWLLQNPVLTSDSINQNN
jgi:hypothetical protein